MTWDGCVLRDSVGSFTHESGTSMLRSTMILATGVHIGTEYSLLRECRDGSRQTGLET